MERLDVKTPLLQGRKEEEKEEEKKEEKEENLVQKIWVESKTLWVIVGPTLLTRILLYAINVVTQAFAGHLGDLELAAISINSTVIVGFNFGLMLGMASALETLCGQAYGAKRYHMLGIYLQRSFIVLFLCALLLLPMYVFATPILKAMGQPKELAETAGNLALWMIPQHFSFVILLPITRFLQSQIKVKIPAVSSAVALVFHLFISWLFISKLKYGIIGAAITLNLSFCLAVLIQVGYILFGGCPLSWKGFSMEAFHDLWDFLALSAASGVMLCLENWYYRILVLLAGNLSNAEVAIDALSICMNVNGWEFMIHLAFFAGTGVRVANELGSGNGKKARFASLVAMLTSLVIGLIFFALTLSLHDKFAFIFTTSPVVLTAVDKMAVLLAFTILLNSIQPVLSGVAVGCGWQSIVAYINVACYYIIGLPLGIWIGWTLHFGVKGIWTGMICGTFIQTVILGIICMKCNWENEAKKVGKYMEALDTSKRTSQME